MTRAERRAAVGVLHCRVSSECKSTLVTSANTSEDAVMTGVWMRCADAFKLFVMSMRGVSMREGD